MLKQFWKIRTRFFYIYNRENADQAFIFFEKGDYHLNENFNYEGKYQVAGYDIIEKNLYDILGYFCIWIKSRKISKDQIYKEDIYFKTNAIHITFIGYEENHYYLLEIVNSLSFTEN